MITEEYIKARLLKRGFPEKRIINNRGLIGAVIDEVIMLYDEPREEKTVIECKDKMMN